MKSFLAIFNLVAFALLIALGITGVEYFMGAFVLSVVFTWGLSYVVPKGSLMSNPALVSTEARNLYTKKLFAIFREEVSVKGFMRSFFKTKPLAYEYELAIESERTNELKAKDIVRGTEGNYNEADKFSERIVVPPTYWEYFNVNSLRIYDRVFGQGSMNAANWSALINESNRKLMKLQKKIEREMEYQCAQLLQSGIITFENTTTIDYARKAGSIVDATGNAWTTGANNPKDDIQNGLDFLRQTGKAQGEWFDLIMGQTVFNALTQNDTFQAEQEIRRFFLSELHAPQRSSVGGNLHGWISVGSYKVRLWTYPEGYETIDTSGTKTFHKYIEDYNAVLLPENPQFCIQPALVPQLVEGQTVPQTDMFYVWDYITPNRKNHVLNIECAALAVLEAVDQVYTFQPVASS